MENSLCILVRRSPYGTIHAAEALRHLNGASAGGLKTAAVLVGDGVYSAKEGQETDTTGWTSLSAALKRALEDGPWVYAHEPSLKERGLGLDDLVPGVKTINDVEMATLLAGSRWLMLF